MSIRYTTTYAKNGNPKRRAEFIESRAEAEAIAADWRAEGQRVGVYKHGKDLEYFGVEGKGAVAIVATGPLSVLAPTEVVKLSDVVPVTED